MLGNLFASQQHVLEWKRVETRTLFSFLSGGRCWVNTPRASCKTMHSGVVNTENERHPCALKQRRTKNDFCGVLFVPSLVVVVFIWISTCWHPLDWRTKCSASKQRCTLVPLVCNLSFLPPKLQHEIGPHVCFLSVKKFRVDEVFGPTDRTHSDTNWYECEGVFISWEGRLHKNKIRECRLHKNFLNRIISFSVFLNK